jgi:multidrug efflux pump subunit AcrA (membrane-fusion protein)
MKTISILTTVAVSLLFAAFSFAGPGHDHGDAAPETTSANAPKRQPDGAVFLPKAAQRQMSIRTAPSAIKELPRAIELNGKVLMDPNAGGRVQTMMAGRIEAGPKGLPSLGQAVKKGEVLAYVAPAAGQIEKANQLAQLSELRANYALAEARWNRAEKAGARLQASQAGRIEAVGAWPRLGQSVKAGDVIAYLVPALSSAERSAQLGTLAEVKASRDLAISRVARLRELSGTVPRKEIEAAERERIALDEKLAAVESGVSGKEPIRSPVDGMIVSLSVSPGQQVEARELIAEIEASQASAGQARSSREREQAKAELDSLRGRVNAVAGSVGTRDVLTSPADGVIAASNAVAGQVVDARELVFEVVDPKRLRVEALAFDAAVANDVSSAFILVGEKRAPLTFLGAARSLREQALPLSFRAEGEALALLAVGQPVKVFVQTASKVKGVAVPAGAVVKNPSNQTIVWVKTDSERYVPRVVLTEVLDGATVSVVAGLKDNERVVVSGAPLMNQVR